MNVVHLVFGLLLFFSVPIGVYLIRQFRSRELSWSKAGRDFAWSVFLICKRYIFALAIIFALAFGIGLIAALVLGANRSSSPTEQSPQR
jgi:hypothetical protein